VSRVLGESLAGLFVVETFVLEPTLFRHYIALSPSLWWNREELVQSSGVRLAGMSAAPRTFYLASADEEIIVPGAAALADTLRRRAPRTLTWYFEPRPDLTHGTIYRSASPRAFVKVLQ
jgi:predicted alpha/beta superfamily hydrolase